jgi:hypothetical protein
MKRIALIVALCTLLAPAQDSGKTQVKLGTISVGASYSRFSGPGYYGYPYPYGYDPWFWSPYFYHPGYFQGFHQALDKGEVRLRAEPKADVYLDDAYAGLAGNLRSIWLKPGAYNLSVRAPDRARFERRIYVLTGKTLRINAAP